MVLILIKKLFILIFLIVYHPVKKFLDFLLPLKFKAKDISKELILITGAGFRFKIEKRMRI